MVKSFWDERGPIGFLIRLIALPLAYPLLIVLTAFTNCFLPQGQQPYPSVLDYLRFGGSNSKVTAAAPGAASVNIITIPNTVVLALAVIGGLLEYLNQNTFGFGTHVQEAVRYGILVLTAFGVTIPVGRELGIDIVTLLKIPTYVLLLITIVAYCVAAAVSIFGISGVLKGVILGVVAFITTVFGPAPQDVIVQPPATPVTAPGGAA